MIQEFVKGVKDTAAKAVQDMHTAIPGTIVSFAPSSGMAVVQPKAKFKKPNGETMDYPVISGVPIVFPQGKEAAIAWPIMPGDGCLLIFSESALDYWMYGKETGTSLKFDLSSAIAIPGLYASGNTAMQTACSENAVVVAAGETVIKVKPDGVFIDGDVSVNGKITATGDISSGGS